MGEYSTHSKYICIQKLKYISPKFSIKILISIHIIVKWILIFYPDEGDGGKFLFIFDYSFVHCLHINFHPQTFIDKRGNH